MGKLKRIADLEGMVADLERRNETLKDNINSINTHIMKATLNIKKNGGCEVFFCGNKLEFDGFAEMAAWCRNHPECQITEDAITAE